MGALLKLLGRDRRECYYLLLRQLRHLNRGIPGVLALNSCSSEQVGFEDIEELVDN